MSGSLSSAEMLINMIIQVVILALLVYGFYNLRKTGDRRKHGIIFSVATIVNLGSIIVVMVPSLASGWNSVEEDLSGLGSIIIIHHIVGLVVAVLSVIIVVSWGNRDLPEWDRRGKIGRGCLGEGRAGRALMRLTLILWITSFALGALIYATDFFSI